MRNALSILIALFVFAIIGCEGYAGGKFEFPTTPHHDDYDGGYGGSGGGGYSPQPDIHDGPNLARDVEGEWEGFLWEDYRSDGRPRGKKKVALRLRYSDTTYGYSGRHEWVKVDVLVDGRPAASSTAEVRPGGYIGFSSHRHDIEFEMNGRFRQNRADGDIRLAWDEKVESKWSGDIRKEFVRIRGGFELGRVHGYHWGAAWELFDTFGEDAWDLGDEVWQAATLEGLQHLEEVEQTFVRIPNAAF